MSSTAYQAELRLARRQCVQRGLFVLTGAALWLLLDRTWNSIMAVVLAAGAFSAAAAARDWWRLVHADPASVAASQALADSNVEVAEHVRHAEQLLAHPPYATRALMALIAVVAVTQILTGGILASVDAAGLIKDAVRRGAWWRLLTGTYLHGSVFHFAGNMMALAAVGQLLEAYRPRAYLPLVYLVSALAGGLLSMIVTPHTPSVGASGGIVGVLGYLWILARRSPAVPRALEPRLLSSLGMTACIGIFGLKFIDNGAHAGGAIAGILLGLATADMTERSARTPLVNALGIVSAIVLIGGAAVTVRQLAITARQSASTGLRSPVLVTPIADVGIRLVAMTPNSISVAIDNGRGVPLEAWNVMLLVSAGGRQSALSHAVDACCFSFQGAAAPIAPRSSRVLAFPRPPGAERVTPSLTVALFSDLSFEGSAAERDAILRRREQLAAELSWLIEAVNAARSQSPQAARTSLVDRLNARSRAGSPIAPALAGEIAALVRESEQQPDRWPDLAARYVTERQAARSALLRHKKS